jgi:hypothetical protein
MDKIGPPPAFAAWPRLTPAQGHDCRIGQRKGLGRIKAQMTLSWKAVALPLAILIYAGIAWLVAPDKYPGLLRYYFDQATILPILIGVGLPVAAIFIRPRAPLSYVIEVLKDRGLRLMLVALLFCIGVTGFTTFKVSIPQFVPFYADMLFADIDAALHFGNPGEWAHAIVPGWAQYPLGYLYGPIWFVLWFGLLAFVALQRDRAFRQRYFWSMALTMCLLGTVAATAFSSVGPIFYDDFVDAERFALLQQAISESAIGDYMAQASGYLLANFEAGTGAAGTGISAMPSMHLAIVTLNACMLTSLNRQVGIVAWIYVALIQLGSVYLGWHYAIDGYFSIAVVCVIWWSVRQLQSRLGAKPSEAMAEPLPAL